MQTREFRWVCNSRPTEKESHTPWVRMGWITSGFSPSMALLAARLRTLIPSKSSRFTGRRMARILVSCAATETLMLCSCKSRNRKPCVPTLLALWKDADPDIPHPERSQGGVREAAIVVLNDKNVAIDLG